VPGRKKTLKTMSEVTVTRIRHKKGEKVKLGAFMSCPVFNGKIKKEIYIFYLRSNVRGKQRS